MRHIIYSLVFLIAIQTQVFGQAHRMVQFPDLGWSSLVKLNKNQLAGRLDEYGNALREFREVNKACMDGDKYFVVKIHGVKANGDRYYAYIQYQAPNYKGIGVRYSDSDIDDAVANDLKELNRGKTSGVMEDFERLNYTYTGTEGKYLKFDDFETWFLRSNVNKGVPKKSFISITSEAARSYSVENQIKCHILYSVQEENQYVNLCFDHINKFYNDFSKVAKARHLRRTGENVSSVEELMRREDWRPLGDDDYNFAFQTADELAEQKAKLSVIADASNKGKFVKNLSQTTREKDYFYLLRTQGNIGEFTQKIATIPNLKIEADEVGAILKSNAYASKHLLDGLGTLIPCSLKNVKDGEVVLTSGQTYVRLRQAFKM